MMRLLYFLCRFVDHHWIDFIVNHFNPLFSVYSIKMRVIEIQTETPDTISIYFQPNKRWAGFLPGQFVSVRVLIQGILYERNYSITSDPATPFLRITVKRYATGLVSNWLHDALKIGDILECSPAKGTFLVQVERRQKLLFIAGGVGITPIFSLISAALRHTTDLDIVLGFYARKHCDYTFLNELKMLQLQYRNLRIQLCLTGTSTISEEYAGRFNQHQLKKYCPDFSEREIYVSGPIGLVEAVSLFAVEEDMLSHLHREFFSFLTDQPKEQSMVSVTYLKSKTVQVTQHQTLLQAAEQSGLKPKYGCRLGLCHTCVCMKITGIVRDIRTGTIDNTTNSYICLCISQPLSDVVLEL